MKILVSYQSKYGSTERYAKWIAEALGCQAVERSKVSGADLNGCDIFVYGGGLYAGGIAGIKLVTGNWPLLEGKRVAVFTTSLTPPTGKAFFDDVMERNFTVPMRERISAFHFRGGLRLDELSLPHKAVIAMLRKVLGKKTDAELTEEERLMRDALRNGGDFCDRNAIEPLIEWARRQG